MTTIDWKKFLRKHNVFSALADTDLDRFLDDAVSMERAFPPDNTVIKEGDPGTSIFLVGSGSLRVEAKSEDGRAVRISTIRQGEFFGEIAVVVKRPRTASVVTEEPCVLLEIKGQEFLLMLKKYPDIESKVVAVCERLRNVSKQFITLSLRSKESELKLFNDKLDYEMKAMESSLKATQAMSDQTNLRVHEVLGAAERNRAFWRRFISVAAVILAAISGTLTFFGIEKYSDFNKQFNFSEKYLQQAKSYNVESKKSYELILNIKESLEERLSTVSEAIEQFYTQIMIQNFVLEVERGADADSLLALYETILKARQEDVTRSLYKAIYSRLPVDGVRITYVLLLKSGIEHSITQTPREIILSYYLALMGKILEGSDQDETYHATLKELENYVKLNNTPSIRKMLSGHFDPRLFSLHVEAPSKKAKIDKIWKIVQR